MQSNDSNGTGSKNELVPHRTKKWHRSDQQATKKQAEWHGLHRSADFGDRGQLGDRGQRVRGSRRPRKTSGCKTDSRNSEKLRLELQLASTGCVDSVNLPSPRGRRKVLCSESNVRCSDAQAATGDWRRPSFKSGTQLSTRRALTTRP